MKGELKKVGQYWVPAAEEIQCEALMAGGWQLDHLEVGLSHVKSFGVAIDGGAHIGSWTLAMAKRFDQVIAFEPDPNNFYALQKNTGAIRNVVRREEALGEEFGTSGMADDEKYPGKGNTGGRYLTEEKGRVSIIPLDSLKLQRLDFLKLDIEGYEVFALRGAGVTIQRCKPVVMIEDKPRMARRYNLEPHTAQELLASFGMKRLEKVGSDYVWGR